MHVMHMYGHGILTYCTLYVLNSLKLNTLCKKYTLLFSAICANSIQKDLYFNKNNLSGLKNLFDYTPYYF